ncbi:hypothetical protein [Acinetobacter nosocomialis]|uniref:hypothetical protein n=1 Tax=Acinetobacter nosocomialis TaxID=106654 RepID=UPI00339F5726
MIYDITFRSAYSAHEGGTKYYSLFLLNVKSQSSELTFLYKVYGSIVRKNSTTKVERSYGDSGCMTLVNEYQKTIKAKGKEGEYSKLYSSDTVRKLNNFPDLTHHLKAAGAVPPLNDSSFEGAIGRTHFAELLEDISNELNIAVEDMLEQSEEALKKRQQEKELEEALAAQLMAQRQEHYGEVLGSW